MNGVINMKKNNVNDSLIGSSSSITNIRNSISGIANSNLPVLISGEIGTGKHLIAKLIRSQDKNSSDKLIEINCLAIPQRLHEEFLLGYIDEQGDEYPGILEGNENSCLLIENLENLSENAQSGILGLILYGTYYAKGGREANKINVRIIATTDKKLSELQDLETINQKFLEEIKKIYLHIPNLEERKEDIPLLVKHFVKSMSEEIGQKPPVIPPELIGKYYTIKMNGNVSQLKSSIRTLLIASNGNELNIELFPEEKDVATPDLLYSLYQQFKEKSQSLREFRHGIEGTIIKFTLEETNYNAAKVGRILGLSEAGMRRAMERLGILTKRQRRRLPN